MRLTLLDWKSPVGIEYIVETGGKTVEKKRLVFDKDVTRNQEEANEQIPFAGDVLQNVINRHDITNPFVIPFDFEDMLKDVKIHERRFTPKTGQPVWFPVGNGIKLTDPFSTAADPAQGYVKSVDDNGVAEIDVRNIYKRIKPVNIVDESRKMEPMNGTTYVDTKFCFENRRECMDYIIASSDVCEIFRAEIKTQEEMDFADAVASIPVDSPTMEQ